MNKKVDKTHSGWVLLIFLVAILTCTFQLRGQDTQMRTYQTYYFTLEAFNENGISERTEIIEIQ